jgi:hypothetical protein
MKTDVGEMMRPCFRAEASFEEWSEVPIPISSSREVRSATTAPLENSSNTLIPGTARAAPWQRASTALSLTKMRGRELTPSIRG